MSRPACRPSLRAMRQRNPAPPAPTVVPMVSAAPKATAAPIVNVVPKEEPKPPVVAADPTPAPRRVRLDVTATHKFVPAGKEQEIVVRLRVTAERVELGPQVAAHAIGPDQLEDAGLLRDRAGAGGGVGERGILVRRPGDGLVRNAELGKDPLRNRQQLESGGGQLDPTRRAIE